MPPLSLPSSSLPPFCLPPSLPFHKYWRALPVPGTPSCFFTQPPFNVRGQQRSHTGRHTLSQSCVHTGPVPCLSEQGPWTQPGSPGPGGVTCGVGTGQGQVVSPHHPWEGTRAAGLAAGDGGGCPGCGPLGLRPNPWAGSSPPGHLGSMEHDPCWAPSASAVGLGIESLKLVPLIPHRHWVTSCHGLPLLGLWASIYDCTTGPERAEAGSPPAQPLPG